MILVIGEILFDVFPDYSRLGGAPFNFAYHLKNLGFDVRFISRIGIDDAGKEILHHLELARFDLDDIQIDPEHPTGRVEIELDERGEPKFDIIPGVAYDYIEFLPEYHSDIIEGAQIIYFGSLVQRNATGFKNVQKLISDNPPQTLNFYDVNLRPGCYTNAIVKSSLSKTNILKLNTNELEKLKQMQSLKVSNDRFVDHLMKTHSIDTVSLTGGESGSELYTRQGYFSTEPAEAINVADSVGAGDAYAAMLAAGLLKKWRPQEILQRASLFASWVCEIKGAIPDSASFYEPFKYYFVTD